MRKFLFILSVVVWMFVYSITPYAEITAWGYCMMDGHTGRVLYEKNAEIGHEIASITKIMTAICALENASLDETITVSEQAAQTEGSSCWLEENEQLSMEDMLYGLLLASGNDAAVAIAEHVSGSVEQFVALMNDTAFRLGAKDTSFKNPHGLDADGHYSTCRDMAIITKYALEFPVFKTIVGTQRKTIPWQNKAWDRTLNNHNKFLSMYPDVIGVKTGYTDKAGRTLVTAVERGDILLILVTIAAPDDWNDHKKLYDLALSEYRMQEIANTDETNGEVYVRYGKDKLCSYSIDKTFTALLKESETANQFQFQKNIPENIEAPIQKGDIIGHVDIFCEGEWIESCSLIANETIHKSTFMERFCEKITSIFKSIVGFFT